jgi:hypothetical protein
LPFSQDAGRRGGRVNGHNHLMLSLVLCKDRTDGIQAASLSVDHVHKEGYTAGVPRKSVNRYPLQCLPSMSPGFGQPSRPTNRTSFSTSAAFSCSSHQPVDVSGASDTGLVGAVPWSKDCSSYLARRPALRLVHLRGKMSRGLSKSRPRPSEEPVPQTPLSAEIASQRTPAIREA